MFTSSGEKVAENELDPVTEIVTAVVTGVKRLFTSNECVVLQTFK